MATATRAAERRRALLIWAFMLSVGLEGCISVTTPSGAPPDQSPGFWTVLAPMPSTRQEVAVAEADGKIYVIGGFGLRSLSRCITLRQQVSRGRYT